MIKKEIGGKTYYCWEDKEKIARKKFEITIVSDSAARNLMKAAIDAMSEAEAERARAWDQVRAIADLPEADKVKVLSYDWLIGGFRVRED